METATWGSGFGVEALWLGVSDPRPALPGLGVGYVWQLHVAKPYMSYKRIFPT